MDIKQRLAEYLKLPGEDPIGDPLARDALAEIERLEGRVAVLETALTQRLNAFNPKDIAQIDAYHNTLGRDEWT